MPSLNDTLAARLLQVADLDTMSKIGPLIRQDRDLIYVADQGAVYEFVQGSTAAASDWVVLPYDGLGRFVRTEPRTETALADAAAAAGDAATAQAAAEAAQATADAVAPTVVQGRNLIGGYNVADFNAVSYKRFLGMTLVTLDAGTLDPAATGPAVAGDVWTWRGDYWWKIASANGDGFVPAGTVLVMADDGSTIPVGAASGKIATFDGASNDPASLTAPTNYSAVRVVNPDSPFAGQTARWNNLLDSRWSVEAGPNVEALYLNQRHGYFRAVGEDVVTGVGGQFVGGQWDAIPHGWQPPQGTVVEAEWVIVTTGLDAVGSVRFLAFIGAAFYDLLDTGYMSSLGFPLTTVLKTRWVLHTPGDHSGRGASVLLQASAVTTDVGGVNVNTTPTRSTFVSNYDFGECGAGFMVYPTFDVDSLDNSASLVSVTGTITRLPAANG